MEPRVCPNKLEFDHIIQERGVGVHLLVIDPSSEAVSVRISSANIRGPSRAAEKKLPAVDLKGWKGKNFFIHWVAYRLQKCCHPGIVSQEDPACIRLTPVSPVTLGKRPSPPLVQTIATALRPVPGATTNKPPV